MTESNETAAPAAHADENHLIAERRAKLAALRAQGVAFPNDFRRADYAGEVTVLAHPECPPEVVDEAGITFCFAAAFHPAMRHAAVPRKELGIGTAFIVVIVAEMIAVNNGLNI